MRNFIPIWIACLLCMPGFAQEKDAPKNLVGFLKPGMSIAIHSYENSDKISISILTEQDFAIAIDSRNLSLEDLALKYDKVASEIELKRKDAIALLQTRKEKLPAGQAYGVPLLRLDSFQRDAFYKISSIGDDYILVTSATAPEKRRVFATRFISTINWHDELSFSVEYRTEKIGDKTKQ